jgi:hypothetical protein
VEQEGVERKVEYSIGAFASQLTEGKSGKHFQFL